MNLRSKNFSKYHPPPPPSDKPFFLKKGITENSAKTFVEKPKFSKTESLIDIFKITGSADLGQSRLV